MRFTEFSIPESTKWMEKSDILFMLDTKNLKVPFVSTTILKEIEDRGKNLINLISERIHPEDLREFQNIVNERSTRSSESLLRILDHENNVLFFDLHRLKVNEKHSKVLLIAITKKDIEYLEEENKLPSGLGFSS